MFTTRSQQIEVTITGVNRTTDCVVGWKRNLQRSSRMSTPFSVYFNDGEPSKIDGAGVKHPKLVLAAASAAWRNTQVEG